MDYQDIYLQQTDSTNLQARKMAEQGVSHGSGVVADSQTAGRGRLAREWFSPPGKNLYCSYVLRPAIKTEDFSRLTMVAGLAVARYLGTFCPLPIGLKWPNDIHLSGKKCGGILSESSLSAGDVKRSYAIIGIGLNLNISLDELPPHLRLIATSLFIETGETYDANTLFQGIRNSLLSGVREFETKGFTSILKQWKHYDTMLGKWMVWVTSDGKKVTGKSLGPDGDGFLRVEDARGSIHRVISGDVNLVGKDRGV